METQKAIALVAEILDVLVGDFVSDCGGNLAEYPVVSSHGDVFHCEACRYHAQCGQLAKAREINSNLQSLIADKESEDIYDIAYRKGFHDAHGGFEDNPYDFTTEPELYRLYEGGNIDGA